MTKTAEGLLEATRVVPRLVMRDATRTEADVQSDVRALLLNGGLDLDDEDIQVRLEAQAGDGRRIDVEAGFTVIEVKKDLRPASIVPEAIVQLGGYVSQRVAQFHQRYVGVLTDGLDWRLYHPEPDGTLREVSRLQLNESEPDTARLLAWLGAVLATEQHVAPTPTEVDRRLGAESPGHALDPRDPSRLVEHVEGRPAGPNQAGTLGSTLDDGVWVAFRGRRRTVPESHLPRVDRWRHRARSRRHLFGDAGTAGCRCWYAVLASGRSRSC